MDEYTLPTEPGYYLDREDDLWRLTVDGRWLFPELEELSNRPERYAPFTRLMTESQWEANRENRARERYSEIGREKTSTPDGSEP